MDLYGILWCTYMYLGGTKTCIIDFANICMYRYINCKGLDSKSYINIQTFHIIANNIQYLYIPGEVVIHASPHRHVW